MIIFIFRNILVVYYEMIKRFTWINLILMEFLTMERSDYECDTECE